MGPSHIALEGVELKSKLCPELCPTDPLPNPHRDGDQDRGKKKGMRRLERGSRECPQVSPWSTGTSGLPPHPCLAWMEDPRGRAPEAALVLSTAEPQLSRWESGARSCHPSHLLSAARDQGRMGSTANALHPPVATPDLWVWARRDKAWLPPPEDKGDNPNCQLDEVRSTWGSPGPKKPRMVMELQRA